MKWAWLLRSWAGFAVLRELQLPARCLSWRCLSHRALRGTGSPRCCVGCEASEHCGAPHQAAESQSLCAPPSVGLSAWLPHPAQHRALGKQASISEMAKLPWPWLPRESMAKSRPQG